MAGGLNRARKAHLRAALCAVIALAAAPAVQALEDPTRPPPGFGRGVSSAPRGAGASDLVLQSVIISESGRAAIINGARVALGARLGSARLVKVSESEVELLIGNARRRLALYPGVDKRPASDQTDAEIQ
jgi:hypothetical protein